MLIYRYCGLMLSCRSYVTLSSVGHIVSASSSNGQYCHFHPPSRALYIVDFTLFNLIILTFIFTGARLVVRSWRHRYLNSNKFFVRTCAPVPCLCLYVCLYLETPLMWLLFNIMYRNG